jgi:hypothetical protein
MQTRFMNHKCTNKIWTASIRQRKFEHLLGQHTTANAGPCTASNLLLQVPKHDTLLTLSTATAPYPNTHCRPQTPAILGTAYAAASSGVAPKCSISSPRSFGSR